jgi:hypothetical protein
MKKFITALLMVLAIAIATAQSAYAKVTQIPDFYKEAENLVYVSNSAAKYSFIELDSQELKLKADKCGMAVVTQSPKFYYTPTITLHRGDIKIPFQTVAGRNLSDKPICKDGKLNTDYKSFTVSGLNFTQVRPYNYYPIANQIAIAGLLPDEKVTVTNEMYIGSPTKEVQSKKEKEYYTARFPRKNFAYGIFRKDVYEEKIRVIDKLLPLEGDAPIIAPIVVPTPNPAYEEAPI